MEAYLYVISCKDARITERYLGYTTNWEKCVEYHSEAYDHGRNSKTKLYTFVREHGGWDNWDMTILETFESREEAEIAKIGLLEQYDFALNSGKR
jgi:predicted GIY-YIG superfamily endonuclease